MKFSITSASLFALAMTNNVIATASSVITTTELPFSSKAIIEAVKLPIDLAPVVLADSVFFINTTIFDAETGALEEDEGTKLSKRWRARNVPLWARVGSSGHSTFTTSTKPTATARAKTATGSVICPSKLYIAYGPESFNPFDGIPDECVSHQPFGRR